MKRMK